MKNGTKATDRRSDREDQSEGVGCDPNAPENTAIAPKGRQYREGVCRQSASLHEGTRLKCLADFEEIERLMSNRT